MILRRLLLEEMDAAAGSRLLAQAKATFPGNEAKEPDVLYRWLRPPIVVSRSAPAIRPR